MRSDGMLCKTLKNQPMKQLLYIILILTYIQTWSQNKKNNFLNDLIIFDKLSVKNILMYDDSLNVLSMSGYKTFIEFDTLKVFKVANFRTRIFLDENGHIEFFSLLTADPDSSNKYQSLESDEGLAIFFRKNLRIKYTGIKRTDLKDFENEYNRFEIQDLKIVARKVYSDSKILEEIIEYKYDSKNRIISETHFRVNKKQNTSDLYKYEDWKRIINYTENGDISLVNIIFSDKYDSRFLVANEIGVDDVNELIFRKYQTLKFVYSSESIIITNQKNWVNFVKIKDDWTKINYQKGNYDLVLNNPLRDKTRKQNFSETERNAILARITEEEFLDDHD